MVRAVLRRRSMRRLSFHIESVEASQNIALESNNLFPLFFSDNSYSVSTMPLRLSACEPEADFFSKSISIESAAAFPEDGQG